ncbi:DUF4430 domain-containing protein [Neobacillus niacini]|uniref:DUF4430 domain-containing protein n=1 Tax=Neobacillus niacini TaxID=86668 RepID=UPI003003618C
MKNQKRKIWLVMVLVLTLLTYGVQVPALAAEGNLASISVIGLDEANPLFAETSVAVGENETATELLIKAVGENNIEFTDTQFGKMLTGIYGLKPADGETYFWNFLINGKSAQVGSDSYIVQNGDKISFRYTDWTKPMDEPEIETPVEEPVTGDVADFQTALDAVTQYVLSNPLTEFEVISLKQTGKTIPVQYLESVKQVMKEKQGKFSRITDTERYILGVLAAGGDPRNIEGYNLVEAVYNGNVTKQGLIGVSYALIALDSASFEIPDNALWTRDKLTAHLLERQNPDGGWAWDESATSDIDTTGMILASLVPYKDKAGIKEKVDLALQYLSAQYQNSKIDNSSTAAQVVIALSALGVDANGPLFTKDNSSLIKFLLTFQNSDGGFDWQGGDVSDVFSTQQGVQALVAYQLYKQGKGSLYNLPLIPQNPIIVNPEVQTPTQAQVQAPIVKQPAAQVNQVGYPIPNTATNIYNLIALGLLLLAVGSVYYLKQRKA